MRQLALDFLYDELSGTGDQETWYQNLRQNNMGALFPYLIEAARDSLADNYYVLYPDPNNTDVAILEQRVFRSKEDTKKLPFVKTPPRSPDIGPVIKRSYDPKDGGGPKKRTLQDNLRAFKTIGENQEPWSEYFRYVHNVFSRPNLNLKFADTTLEGSQKEPALFLAIEHIPEKKTAFLSIYDSQERLPGEIVEYLKYLQSLLEEQKYARAAAPIEGFDSLIGIKAKVYPNALAGAGVNITNIDRVGVFPSLDSEEAWKKFAISAETADLIYAFSFHLRKYFYGKVAGNKALILPYLSVDQIKRQKFTRQFKNLINSLEDKIIDASSREDRLLRHFKDSPDAIITITIIWAKFGQSLSDVTGIVNDVLPSRLSEISNHIAALEDITNPIFPNRIPSVEPDLAFNGIGALLKRTGGKKNKKANESAKLFEFKRDLAARVYHSKQISLTRFWDELLAVAKSYLIEIAESGNTYGLLSEGVGKKGTFLTLAGWTKYVAKYIYFLRQLEVYPQVNNWHYEPKQETLKSFFADTQATAGLDDPDKVYTFLLGVLFGKVMEVQAAKGVNVGANSLTWLRRLNMTGADLPALYNKVREKLLTYGTESRKEVEAIINEIGTLGIQIGQPDLNKTDACYYLLLGQSLTKTLIPTKERGNT